MIRHLTSVFLLVGLLFSYAPITGEAIEMDEEAEITTGNLSVNYIMHSPIAAHPDPDYEAQLRVDDGIGELGLVQRFQVPNLDLVFTAGLKARADGTGGVGEDDPGRLVDRPLPQRGVTQRSSQIAFDHASQRMLQGHVAIQSRLEIGDVTGHDIQLQRIESAGGRRGTQPTHPLAAPPDRRRRFDLFGDTLRRP